MLIPVENIDQISEDFYKQTVFDRAGYEDFCETWGLTPAFPKHDGGFAVIAYAVPGALHLPRLAAISSPKVATHPMPKRPTARLLRPILQGSTRILLIAWPPLDTTSTHPLAMCPCPSSTSKEYKSI